MRCPQCEHPKSDVIETRASGDGNRRRRQCQACKHRFTTHERIDRRLPLVIKKNGAREPFERDKILAGLRIACRKRPISARHIDEAAARVEQEVVATGGSEIPAAEVGRIVLTELQGLDLVGYLRFASVYQEIQSAEDFLKLLAPWVGGKPEGTNDG
jgi:transcriptional repressor NrdR